MLSSFYVKNFRSVLELKLDFTYGEGKAPNGYKNQDVLPFIQAPKKVRLIPCAAFFGANASGKTNILKAFGALKELILSGDTLDDLYEPNLLNPKFSDTTFRLEFFLGGDSYAYHITYNGSEIREETLLKNRKELFTIQNYESEFSQDLYSTAYSEAKLADILRVECSDGEGRQNKPFLHRMGLAYRGLNTDLRKVFNFFKTGLRFFMNDRPMLLPIAVEVLAETMDGDKDEALRKITDVVRRLDIDISKIEISESELGANETPKRDSLIKHDAESETRHLINITATHKDVFGEPRYLNFIKHESDGTQRVAGLVGLILYALETGGVFLVDELECSIHPLLMREIVLLFKKRRHNPNGAQLIFTTHNTDILDESILRISEITLVRKTVANGTLVRRLIDAKKDGEDIRNVSNFRKQYLAGFYSGVPHPAL